VRDLDLSARLGEMIDLGVTSFKIEGRLKDRAYVRNIVSLYRRLLDEEIAKRNDVERSSVGRSVIEFEPNASRTFTRAAGEYLFDGKSRGVASFDTP
jgi:putative protease